nr:MAG TPA: hypothetical protein [Bacteriophage sp.]
MHSYLYPFRFETPDFHSRVIFWYHGVHTV